MQDTDQIADVFFLHPTSLTNKQDTLLDNARIDDAQINDKTDYSSILYQASIFNQTCRVFAPRYRQAHLRMYYLPDTVRALTALDLAYRDIRTAFLYYLQHHNNGRPIIIASHSQGTTHAKKLLKEFFEENPLLRKQLVVAYLLGIPVEKNYISTIPPCADSLSTGCLISWRTYRSGYEDKFISATDNSIVVINPYSWNDTNAEITKKAHQGAVLYKFNKVYHHTQTARIAGNALWISKPKFPGAFLYNTKNYHVGDYNLFYLNIRNDIGRRTRQFLLNNNQ